MLVFPGVFACVLPFVSFLLCGAFLFCMTKADALEQLDLLREVVSDLQGSDADKIDALNLVAEVRSLVEAMPRE